MVWVVLATLLLGTLVGWTGHWALHQRWAGRFHRSHLTHHRLYPPSSLRSAQYRDAKQDNTTLFLGPAIALVSLVGLGVLVWLQMGWPVYMTVVLLGSVVGYLHEYLHEAFHLEAHRLDRYAWFQTLRDLHLEHHRKVNKNLGILWFGWDRFFDTFVSKR